MRVLLVTPFYPPAYAFGGPVRVTEAIARHLVAAGHEVAVATTDALDEHSRVPPAAPPVPPEAEVHRFPNASHALAVRLAAFWPRGYRSWVRGHASRFDVVHLNDLYSILSVAAARAAIRAGVPYVLQPHGGTAASRERGRPLAKRAFLAAWGSRTITGAAATLAITENERADLLQAGAPAERIAVIPLPLDLPHVASREELESAPTVVFLGRFDAIKGLDRLVEAVALARREVPELRLRLVGGGPYEPQLRRIAPDAEFAGFLDGEAKVRALQSAHAFALLSRSEGLPVAALEAMACGTPAILSAGCNLPEVHERAGLVVDGSPAEAAAAIVRIVRDPDLRARLGAGAEAFAEAYRGERVLPRLLELYAQLAAGRPT